MKLVQPLGGYRGSFFLHGVMPSQGDGYRTGYLWGKWHRRVKIDTGYLKGEEAPG